MRKINLNILVAFCVFMMTLAVPAAAVTHYVSPSQSIQAAIDGASNGDEIEVSPGIYNEAINFNGKAVRLYSSGGAEVTTINGTGHYHVVQCVSNEGADTVLEGFRITDGNANGAYPDYYGGGMYNNGSSPTVTNCTFTGNMASAGNEYVYGYGGGMFNDQASPTVTNCTFSGNTAESGGGMYNSGSNSRPTVTNCAFVGNLAYSATAGWWEGGGGMYNYNSSPTVTNCTFSGNTAYFTSTDWTGGGGGMSNIGSSPTLTNCIFVGNLALSPVRCSYGGGMYNGYRSNPTVTNCTFSNNKASYGAGLSNYSECTAIVKNCIFWQDESLLGPFSYEIFNHTPAGYYEDPGYIGYSTAIVSYSDIENSAMFGLGHDAGGNISTDPNFVAPGYWDANGTPEDLTDDIWVNGDYHLSPGSPCIDAGSNLGVDIDKVDLDSDGITNEPVPLDMDGYPRFTDDPNTPDSGVYFTPGFPIVDMGAYERPGIVPIPGDSNCDGKVDFRDIAVVAGNWLAGTEPEL